MKKFLAGVVVVFVIFWASSKPASAAVVGKALLAGLGATAGGLIDFVTRVSS